MKKREWNLFNIAMLNCIVHHQICINPLFTKRVIHILDYLKNMWRSRAHQTNANMNNINAKTFSFDFLSFQLLVKQFLELNKWQCGIQRSVQHTRNLQNVGKNQSDSKQRVTNEYFYVYIISIAFSSSGICFSSRVLELIMPYNFVIVSFSSFLTNYYAQSFCRKLFKNLLHHINQNYIQSWKVT